MGVCLCWRQQKDFPAFLAEETSEPIEEMLTIEAESSLDALSEIVARAAGAPDENSEVEIHFQD